MKKKIGLRLLQQQGVTALRLPAQDSVFHGAGFSAPEIHIAALAWELRPFGAQCNGFLLIAPVEQGDTAFPVDGGRISGAGAATGGMHRDKGGSGGGNPVYSRVTCEP